MANASERAANLATIKSNLMPDTSKASSPPPDRIPIIDSHIHLYPASEAHTLSWLTPDTPSALQGQHSLAEYTSDTQETTSLEGFIFLETDRKYDAELAQSSKYDGQGWEGPLMEVEWLKRIATGAPREGEGHTAEQAKLCLAIVPWAPVAAGVEAMEAYVKLAEKSAGVAWGKVRGFRYLVQDKPDGTMLEEDFVRSLRWLGEKGFVFDVGVDFHRRGEGQLKELLECLEMVRDGVAGSNRTVFVLNHLCKPDLTITGDVTNYSSFQAWRSSIFTLSAFPLTYMKLSGVFSELPSTLQAKSAPVIFEAIMPWLIVILTAFRGRLMFGSDWPVCSAGVGDGNDGTDGPAGAFEKWKWIVERLVDLAGLTIEEEVMIWSGTAIEAYGIKELM